MKKNPFLILILLLFSLVTNVSAANAPEDATLTVKMYNFYKGYPLEPKLTYTGTIENITYSYKRYNDASYSSNCSNLTKDQLLTKLESESVSHYHLQVSCTLNGTTTTATKDFWIALYSNNVRDYGGPGTEETITTFSDLHLDVDRCVLKDAGGNIIIKLVKGNSSYYHLYVAPGVSLGDYELPIYQINTTPQICKLNVMVVPFKRDVGSLEYLPTLESALKQLYPYDPTTIKITLLADYSGEETTFNIDDGHDYILNLNGYNMSGNFTFNISKGSSLTINGDNEKTNLNAQFQINYDEEYSGTIPNSLTINGGKYTTTENFCISITDDKAKVTLNGGIFKGAKAVINKNYNFLNQTEGHETAFYIYEDGIKYFVGTLGTDGKQVVVQECDTMPFKVDYSFVRQGRTDNTEEVVSGITYLRSFSDVADYKCWNEKFEYNREGSDYRCDQISATITLQCNYKGFSDGLHFQEKSVITLDLKSTGSIMDSKGVMFYIDNNELTIKADPYKTKLLNGFIVGKGTKLTINGGQYENINNAFQINSSGVTINSGTFIGKEGAFYIQPGYAADGAKITLGKNSYYFDTPDATNILNPQPKFDANGYLRANEKHVTIKKKNQAYAELSADGKTLTFKYDGYFMPDENAWEIPEYDPDKTPTNPGWIDPDVHPENITTVVFDPSFLYCNPSMCYRWFYGFSSLKTIIGMKEYLDPFRVVSTQEMFSGCSSLTSLDLSEFTTSQYFLTNMQQMFENCSLLEKLDLSKLNTKLVTKMGRMFANCGQLKELKFGGGFTTNNVQSFVRTFVSCHNLEELDLSTFNTESATDMTNMFGNCEHLKVVKFGKDFKPATNIGEMFFQCLSLQTIIVDNDDWNVNFEPVEHLFDDSEKLTGGNGTKYDDANKANLAYFRIDRDGAPGYLTKLPYTVKCLDEEKELNYLTYLPFDNSISLPEYNQSSATVVIHDDVYKDGYTFLGWTQKMSNGKYTTTPSTGISIDPTLDSHNRIYKANWAVIPYTITYDLGGGELPQGAVNPSTYNIESHFTLYNPTLAGSEFLGWNNGSNATNLSSVEIKNTTGNMTWTAKWRKIQYTITYYVGDKVYTTQNYEFGEDIVPPADPTNGSYTFLDWYPELPKTCEANLVVTAVWNDGNVTIAFDTQGGTLIPSITQQAGSKIENWPKDPEKENFVFDGWDKGIPTTMPTTNTTYTAKWIDKEYTITFDTKGGSEIKPISGTFGTLVTMPKEPTKTGYDFGEWSEIAAQIIEDKTITVIWKAHPYKITYNLDGGYLPNGKSNPETYTIESETFTLENPQKTSYTFVGWTFDNTTSKEVSIEKGTTGDKSFTAKWAVKIVATLSESASFPQDEIKYCKKEETSVLMDYTIESGGNPTNYKVTLNDVETTLAIDNQQSITIPIPDDIKSGEYVASVVFLGDGVNSIDSDPYSITITATVPVRNAAVQLYTDMLIVDNHEGIYNAYQWYRNGEALSGATLQYYTEPKFDYNSLYTVKLSGDGKEMMSCPVEWLSTAKALKPSIKVYPNPAKQNENFTLEILDFDEDQNYDIVIFTANGTMVKKISNVEQKTSVTLPSGVYSGSLINGGEKKGFKLIVK